VLQVGDKAPEIDAIASDGQRFVLSRRLGLCTIIYFFPRAFTPGCTKESKGFGDDYMELQLAGANVVGISSDDGSTQCRFAESLHLPFPLIGDDDLSISKAYKVKWPLLPFSKRVTYAVGRGRRVLAAWRYEVAIDKHRSAVLSFVNSYTQQQKQQSAAYHSEEVLDEITDRRRR